jgi:hypothetical protein
MGRNGTDWSPRLHSMPSLNWYYMESIMVFTVTREQKMALNYAGLRSPFLRSVLVKPSYTQVILNAQQNFVRTDEVRQAIVHSMLPPDGMALAFRLPSSLTMSILRYICTTTHYTPLACTLIPSNLPAQPGIRNVYSPRHIDLLSLAPLLPTCQRFCAIDRSFSQHRTGARSARPILCAR